MAGAANFSKCSEQLRVLLDNEDLGARDFWQGYKLYCFAHYSHCETSKEMFQDTKMGHVMCALQGTLEVPWGAQFDAAIRDVWAMMKEYVHVRHNKDCTNLRALMEEFDDEDELAASKNGSLLLQLIEDDKYGTEHLHRESQTIHFGTDIFDEFRARLNQAQANLDNLTPERRASRRHYR